ncbi:alpha-D-ribose 1-methylphosphonate 5-triphosphate diphosphatase [Pseudooceanicola nanhaiensis]|uniref:alpha-D-ribose 1-methylphosphonate 5-triphosphate diphosphatase n=1 Tax=Pseudooceanicola nanhaiensis TaxID=375761 RepID=UPI001CD8120E|nr:alpha-D-ribose 1-methylphosphonate 5-triphosphate diphosphatase [Pseudooceanicola nanhaiensis]MCA0920070.1 alpha-D-ribose 1-methylphosphonate 5-triphosphate diphosphatase [Pseudooceanicola nanhaiensis]
MSAAPALPPLAPFHITGAEILHPAGAGTAPLGISGECLVAGTPGRAVNLAGWCVLPGIVDPHGDGFERHLAPRRGALRDVDSGLYAAEAELAANGITTATLAQFWSWEGGMRSPEFACAMLEALERVRPQVATDLRAQLRLEVGLVEDYPRVLEIVRQHGVRYLVFNDHLPHAALEKGKRPPRLTGQALKSGRSPEAHLALMQRLHEGRAQWPAALAPLIDALTDEGVALGSHDDATTADRDVWAARGVAISEFPETREAALAAQGPVVMGAPNVVRGGSHAGKISAADLVAEGLVSALASDYHYPAPRQAALALAPRMGLAAAWALVSSEPAQMLGLTDRGTLAPGLRADLTVIDRETGRVGATLAAGRITYLAGAAPAFLA